MDQSGLAEPQKDIVRRYVEVWRQFRRLPDRQSGFVDLEDDMNRGSGMLLCGLMIEAKGATVITADVKDPKFYAAIFGNDDSAAPDITAEQLDQARRYIIRGEGTAPSRWCGPSRRNAPGPNNRVAACSVLDDRFGAKTRSTRLQE